MHVLLSVVVMCLIYMYVCYLSGWQCWGWYSLTLALIMLLFLLVWCLGPQRGDHQR